MKNIWYIFGTVAVSSIVVLIFCLIYSIRKEKYFILVDLILIPIGIFNLIDDIPYMKDLVKQETTEVVAVYTKYQTGNVHPGAKRLFFEDVGDEFNLLAPTVTKDCVKMEIGKTYRIEYFSNCRVIKNYELIE